jgi:hypothetical protein
MRGFVLAVASAGAVVAVACGGGSQMMMDVPVKQQPLAGTVNGLPFTAVSATASGQLAMDTGGAPGDKWIDIYDSQVDCSNSFPSYTRKLITTVPWKVTSYNFGFTQNLTFAYQDDAGVSQNEVATLGRAEIISAPDAGTGTIRIRAEAHANNTVEGEIQVQVCD